MLLLGVANFLLKAFIDEAPRLHLQVDSLVPAVFALVVGIGLAAFFAYNALKPPFSLVWLFAGWALVSIIAVAFVFLALQTGKVATVTAMLALSAVVVAVLSFFVSGERFTAAEMFGMLLALGAVFAFSAG